MHCKPAAGWSVSRPSTTASGLCTSKRQFGFVKARYKGLLKNDNQLAMLFTSPGVRLVVA